MIFKELTEVPLYRVLNDNVKKGLYGPKKNKNIYFVLYFLYKTCIMLRQMLIPLYFLNNQCINI